MGNWNQCFLWFSCYLLENMCLLVNPRFCGLGLYGGYEELCQWSYMVDILSRPAPKFFFFSKSSVFRKDTQARGILRKLQMFTKHPCTSHHILWCHNIEYCMDLMFLWCSCCCLLFYLLCFFLCFALLMPGIGLYLGVEQYIYLK